jgi:hypothetical protein
MRYAKAISKKSRTVKRIKPLRATAGRDQGLGTRQAMQDPNGVPFHPLARAIA